MQGKGWVCSRRKLLFLFIANPFVDGFLFPVVHRVVSVSLGSTLPSTIQEDSYSGKTSSVASFSSVSSVKAAFEAAVLNRYACKKFQRYDGVTNATIMAESASPADPNVVQQALQCLDLARRSPSGFNTQPYKVVLVQSAEQKTALAKYCSGPNAQRVRDSDCTAIFLADRQILRTLPKFQALTKRKETAPPTPPATTKPTFVARLKKLQLPFYIALFSSGYPLPRFLAAPISMVFRFFFYLLSLVAPIPLPTLSSSETWSIKNTMLVAMTYMLACTSRGIQTLPMEGFSAWGIRKVLKIPRRYAIPVIVSTGHAYQAPAPSITTTTDVKSEGKVVESRISTTPRYPFDQVVVQDVFSDSSE